MKKTFFVGVLIIFPLLALGGLFWFLHVKHQLPTDKDNRAKVALEFKDNTIQCPECHM